MKNMFSATSLFVSIPSTLKIHSWTVTLQTGNLQFSISTLFLFTFLIGILIGGITGMIVGTAGFDVLYHDTYYVIGHFHLVLSMGVCCSFWSLLSLLICFFRVRYNKLFAIFHFIFFFFWGAAYLYSRNVSWNVRYAEKNKRLPYFFNGWHGLSSLGHGFVIISLFIFFYYCWI